MRTVCLILLATATFCPAWSQSTIAENESLVWAPNIGWIECRTQKGIVVGGTFLSGYAWSAATGWIHLGDGEPLNGHSYSNDGSDHGVNHDGVGGLSGYAWSPNIGWVTFDWAGATDPNRPRFDIATGAFSGYAWSPAVGWIHLGTGLLTTSKIQRPDSDNDGIEDAVEYRLFSKLTVMDATSNQDGDTATDLEEYRAGTDILDDTKWLKMEPPFRNTEGLMVVNFLGIPGRGYQLYSRTLLGETETWTPLGSVFYPETEGLYGLTVSPPETSRFYRVEALIP